jgi:putative membrane protein
MTPALVSGLHMLTLAAAVSCLFLRDRAMTAAIGGAPLAPLFRADNWAGITGIALVGSGLWRLLAGLEKPTAWYLDEYAFHLKLGLIGLMWVFEIPLMITLIRWRVQIDKGTQPDLARLPRLRRFNRIELGIAGAVVFAAATMAHGGWHKAAASRACAVEDAFVARCLSCHGAAAPQGGLVLAGDQRAALVGKPSTLWPGETLVVPGDPHASLLWKKLGGTQASSGLSMPMGQPIDAALAAQVEAWIAAGAPACER